MDLGKPGEKQKFNLCGLPPHLRTELVKKSYPYYDITLKQKVAKYPQVKMFIKPTPESTLKSKNGPQRINYITDFLADLFYRLRCLGFRFGSVAANR